MKTGITSNGRSNPYFDEIFDYWMGFWSLDMGLKNPDFTGIVPFTAHEGFRPFILPRHELITTQYLYDRCEEKFGCWKWFLGSLDLVVAKNDRDPRAGAYVVWFHDRVDSDKELLKKSANELDELKIPGITLLEREVMEYDRIHRRDGHLDIDTITLCSGSRFTDGRIPRVRVCDGEMIILRSRPTSSFISLRSREAFSFR